MEEKLIVFSRAIKKQEVNLEIDKQINKKSEMYASDFERFRKFVQQNGLELSFEGLEAYS